jgi:GntR family transcriptional regulator, transcriptional repressor for pyruvate dehydrogenase complex
MTLLKPVSRDTLTSQATETIKRFIIEENIETGSQLPSERELSEMLAVSRNIVREALSALMAEGIIVKQVGKGTFVGAFDRDSAIANHVSSSSANGDLVSVHALREARAALEIGAAGLIVQRIDDEEIQALKDIVDRHEQKGKEGKSTIKEDIDFHLVLLKASKNPVIAEMAPLVVELFRRQVAEAPLAMRQPPERIISEHRRIIDALERRDLAATRDAMHQHYYLQDFPL